MQRHPGTSTPYIADDSTANAQDIDRRKTVRVRTLVVSDPIATSETEDSDEAVPHAKPAPASVRDASDLRTQGNSRLAIERVARSNLKLNQYPFPTLHTYL